MITKEDFVMWKEMPVTQAFFDACEQRVEDCKEILSTSAGVDTLTDRFYAGFIAAYREMQDFRVEDEE